MNDLKPQPSILIDEPPKFVKAPDQQPSYTTSATSYEESVNDAKKIIGKDAAQEMLGSEAVSDDFSERTHHNLVAHKEDCELVYEANTNKVSLVNVGQLHSTYNPDPSEGRWTLCFVPARKERTNKRHLTFAEAVEVFEPYIEGDENGY